MTLFEKLKFKGLLDSHAHLGYLTESEVEQEIKSSKEALLETVFNMGINLESSIKVINQSKNSKNYLRAFVGIDPEIFEPGSDLFVGIDKNEAWIDLEIEKLKQLIRDNSEFVFGIGETGMDFYHFEKNKVDDTTKQKSKKLQEYLFRKHLELAQEINLPVSLHSRWAEEECLEIVSEFNCRGIFHSYTGSYETAKKILDSGWGLGVNGIVTFKNSQELKSTYKKLVGIISLDANPEEFYKRGIYFETDSPFLSPEGKRGEKNNPANTKIIFDSFINMLKQ